MSTAFPFLDLARTRITAPVGGILSKRAVEKGQAVQPGQPVCAIVSLEEWSDEAFVPG